MLSKTLQNTINNQIQAEMFSSYLYLSMSAYCEMNNFLGAAKWFKMQSEEEWGHAMKFYGFIIERGGKITLKAIDEPQLDFKSLLGAFEETLTHEKKVTALINKLYEQSLKESDYATQIFLQWFITEQVEEEANAIAIIERIKMVGEKASSLLWIDKELGKRAKE
ncbi:MAG: ferritin [Bacteroidota bacterium]|nr:ferritin [Bacteroidota bacterium]